MSLTMSLAFAPSRGFFRLSPLNKRRLANFRANRRAYYAFWIFLLLYVISLGAELVANDKPLLVSYKGDIVSPVFSFYPETRFGGEYETEAVYKDPAVQCLIRTGGVEDCFDEPEEAEKAFAEAGETADAGWILWAPIPWSHDTINREAANHPAPPSAENYLGTDDGGRDVLAVTLYGFRISVTFGLIVTAVSSMVGVLAGGAMGYFGGWVDLFFQRVVEIWSSTPTLFVVLIITSVFAPNFWLLVGVITLFSWTTLTGVVRAEFLRARNFEYVMAARALGLSDAKIIVRHVLPNAMVATLTFLPFVLTGAIGLLATLDFLGFGLTGSYPSLGEIGLQAKRHLEAWWLAATAFGAFAIMLSLLVFVFEGVRDAFDPRKVFTET